jgi:hypothetical protein
MATSLAAEPASHRNKHNHRLIAIHRTIIAESLLGHHPRAPQLDNGKIFSGINLKDLQ